MHSWDFYFTHNILSFYDVSFIHKVLTWNSKYRTSIKITIPIFLLQFSHKPTDWACFRTDSQKFIGQSGKIFHPLRIVPKLLSSDVIIRQVNTVKTPVWTACLPPSLSRIGPTSPLFNTCANSLPLSHRLSRNGKPQWEEKKENASLRATCPVWLINHLSLSPTISTNSESCAFKVVQSQGL